MPTHNRIWKPRKIGLKSIFLLTTIILISQTSVSHADTSSKSDTVINLSDSSNKTTLLTATATTTSTRNQLKDLQKQLDAKKILLNAANKQYTYEKAKSYDLDLQEWKIQNELLVAKYAYNDIIIAYNDAVTEKENATKNALTDPYNSSLESSLNKLDSYMTKMNVYLKPYKVDSNILESDLKLVTKSATGLYDVTNAQLELTRTIDLISAINTQDALNDTSISENKTKIESLTKQLNSLGTVNVDPEKVNNLNTQIEQKTDILDNYKADLSNAKSTLNVLNTSKAETTDSIASKNNELETIKSQVSSAKTTLDSETSKLVTLESAVTTAAAAQKTAQSNYDNASKTSSYEQKVGSGTSYPNLSTTNIYKQTITIDPTVSYTLSDVQKYFVQYVNQLHTLNGITGKVTLNTKLNSYAYDNAVVMAQNYANGNKTVHDATHASNRVSINGMTNTDKTAAKLGETDGWETQNVMWSSGTNFLGFDSAQQAAWNILMGFIDDSTNVNSGYGHTISFLSMNGRIGINQAKYGNKWAMVVDADWDTAIFWTLYDGIPNDKYGAPSTTATNSSVQALIKGSAFKPSKLKIMQPTWVYSNTQNTAALKTKLTEATTALTNAQNAYDSQKSIVDTANSNYNTLNSRYASKTTELESLNKTLTQQNSNISEVQTNINTINTNITKTQADLDSVKNKLNELLSSGNSSNSSTALDLQEQISNLNVTNTQLSNQKEKNALTLKTLKSDKSRYNTLVTNPGMLIASDEMTVFSDQFIYELYHTDYLNMKESITADLSRNTTYNKQLLAAIENLEKISEEKMDKEVTYQVTKDRSDVLSVSKENEDTLVALYLKQQIALEIEVNNLQKQIAALSK